MPLVFACRTGGAGSGPAEDTSGVAPENGPMDARHRLLNRSIGPGSYTRQVWNLPHGELLSFIVDDIDFLARPGKLEALADLEFLLGRILFEAQNTLLLFFDFAVHFLCHLFEFFNFMPLGKQAGNSVRSL